MEISLQQSLIMSRGGFTIFATRPISAVVLFIAATLSAAPILRQMLHSRPTCKAV